MNISGSMMAPVNANDSKLMALDSRGLDGLKNSAKAEKGSKEFDGAIDKVAKQFESVFLQWALKSMRDATPEGGLFTDSSSKSFQSMYDQELVQHISSKGVGLASEIARQLRGMTQTTPAPQTSLTENAAPAGVSAAETNSLTGQPSTLRKFSR
ncbi:MAG: rod-binding protein [Limnobacter sp.]|nr:rod-binding protein [Limnobacter sp.]